MSHVSAPSRVFDPQDSVEHSYSKPESLRTMLPLTACPVASAPAFRTRELALKCETFAFMQPRPVLAAALVPVLRKLDPFDVIIGVHLRTGYADWTFRNDDSYFGAKTQGNGADAAGAAKAPGSDGKELHTSGGQTGAIRGMADDVVAHWRRLEKYFHDCQGGQSGPCFNWLYPRRGRHPRREDALRCGGRAAAHLPAPWGAAEAPRGFLSSLLLCAARVAQAASVAHKPSRTSAAAPAAAPRLGDDRGGGDGARWGLLVLSDAPALPSLAAHLPALRGRVVATSGAGSLGHSSFARSCSAKRGCSRGRDPNGVWTRSLVDFYLAGVADGFVKGLFTSFLFSTMRRSLICCASGDRFVQWMA
jgi:hypothetical protein